MIVSKETVLFAEAPLASWMVMFAEYRRLLLRAALTISPVFGPVMVSPFAGVRFAMVVTPVNFFSVSATVTLVTPTAELARNDSVGEY